MAKPLVVISKINLASQNIKQSILRLETPVEQSESHWIFSDFEMAEYGPDIIYIEPSHPADYYVFASTHKSASNTPAFTAHTPGNWGGADLGGKPRTLNVAMGSKVKVAAQTLAKLAPSAGWEVEIEADHHGPTIETPLMFVEIGSTEKEWKDELAGEIAAKAILAAIRSSQTFPAFVGFGGTHYAPKFAPKIINGDIAFGHIISAYAIERDGVDEERVRQAMEKNVETVEKALIDWKGIKGEPRKRLVETLDAAGLKWEKA